MKQYGAEFFGTLWWVLGGRASVGIMNDCQFSQSLQLNQGFRKNAKNKQYSEKNR